MQAVIHLDKELYKLQLFQKLNCTPFELQVCGKKILDYYFESFLKLGVEKVFFLGLEKQDEKRVKTFENKGIEIEFSSCENLKRFYLEGFSYLSTQDLLCIKNIGFFNLQEDSLEKSFKYESSSFALFFIKEHRINLKLDEIDSFVSLDFILNLDSFKEYFLVNKYVSQNVDAYELKNYNSKKSVLIGKDTNLHNSVKLIEPVIICDEVQIAANCTIGPNVTLHKGVVIQEDCEIKNSVIYKDTFITQGLFLDTKLIFKENIYDVKANILYEIDNKFINKSRVNLFEKLFSFAK